MIIFVKKLVDLKNCGYLKLLEDSFIKIEKKSGEKSTIFTKRNETLSIQSETKTQDSKKAKTETSNTRSEAMRYLEVYGTYTTNENNIKPESDNQDNPSLSSPKKH